MSSRQSLLTRSRTSQADRRSLGYRFRTFWYKHGVAYAFMAPFLILFFVFMILPVLVALGTSFTNYNMLQPPQWLGLKNYKFLFMDDDVFLIALKNTFVFAFVTGPIGYIMSFLAAWVINQLKMRNAFALAFYAPSITSAVAMSIVWLVIFSPDRYGYLNNFLINLGLIMEPVNWTKDPKTILPVIMVVSVWMSMGTGFLVFLAGLQTVPQEMYEAGDIDGIQNKFQQLWYLTIPMVKPQLLFGAITAIVISFAVFDVSVSLAGMPSPQYAGHTIVTHLMDYAFLRFQMGYASGVAVVLFALTFILGRLSFRLLASRDQ